MVSLARQELHHGSFKGIPFLYRTVSEEGSIKHVMHEYPNSDKQAIEVLGVKPSPFTIEIVVNNNNDVEKKRKLLAAFRLGEKGIFVHPVDGPLNDMYATTWKPGESDSSVGVTLISVTFVPGTTTGLPKKVTNQNSRSEIEKQAEDAEEKIVETVSEQFSLDRSLAENFKVAQDKLENLVTIFENVAKDFTTQVGDVLDEYNSAVTSFESNINELIQLPDELGSTIKNLMVKVAPLIADKNDAGAALSTFFPYGDDDVVIIPTTQALIQRKLNNDTLNTSVQGLALSEAYLASTDTDFTTVDDVITEADNLEITYQKIITNSELGDMSGLNSDALVALATLRTSTQQFLDNEKVSAKQVVSVFTVKTSARLLAYQYYADSESGENIAVLNSEINVSSLQGNVDIFTV